MYVLKMVMRIVNLKVSCDLLQDGGEVYFSDVYTDTKLSEEARKDEVLWGKVIYF